MTIEILSCIQTALIIPAKTGIMYSNQVGGTRCEHPELEGYLVPVEYGFDRENPKNSLTYKVCSLFPDGCPGIVDLDIANNIQSYLNQSPYTRDIVIDERRLSESKEAWVLVNLIGSLDNSVPNFEGVSAILTWPNSD